MSNTQGPTVVTRVIPIPKDKVGLVIGRKGSRIREIREQTGVQLSINKENQALLRGTAEQCQNAEKIIKEIVTVRAHYWEKEAECLYLTQCQLIHQIACLF